MIRNAGRNDMINRNYIMNKREEKLMSILWNSEKPLTVADIETLSDDEHLGRATVFKAVQSLLEKGFIRAEVISYEDLIECGSELKVKEAGKARLEGKDYLMQDGDICHFRFNV